MERIKIEFKHPEKKNLTYNGVEFELDPFLTLTEQVFLINKYVEDFFETQEGKTKLIEKSKFNRANAEFYMLDYILQLKTNINVEELDNDIRADDDFMLLIKTEITNFISFEILLGSVIQDIMEEKRLATSLGVVIEQLSKKAFELLDKVTDITPEQLEKLQETGKELMERMEKSSVLRDITLDEVNKSNVGES